MKNGISRVSASIFLFTVGALACSSGGSSGAGDGGVGFGGSGAAGGTGGAAGTSGFAGAAGAGTGGVGGSGGTAGVGGSGATAGVGGSGGTAGVGGSGATAGVGGGGSGGTAGSGGSGGSGGSAPELAKNVAVDCGASECLVTWQKPSGLYGAKLDDSGKTAAPMLLHAGLPGTVSSESHYVAADGNQFYVLYESQVGSTIQTRLLRVNSSVTSLPVPASSLGSSQETLTQSSLVWRHGIGMIASRYFSPSFGLSPSIVFIGPSGAWVGQHPGLPFAPGILDYGPFGAGLDSGFAVRWDADDKVYPPDCGWELMTATGAKTSFNCPGTPNNTIVYAVRSIGNTVYVLQDALTTSIAAYDFGAATNGGFSSIDDASRDFVLDANQVWITTFQGKIERKDVATKSASGSMTLPAPAAALGGMAMAQSSTRVVVARVPASNPSFSALVYSFPKSSMNAADVATEVVP